MNKIIYILMFSVYLSANCYNGNIDVYDDICNELIKEKKVNKKYFNKFLNSYNLKKQVRATVKLLAPREIKKHKKRELKANRSMVIKKSIKQIKENLKKYKTIYDLAEKKYKVNREIISATLMKETRLGKYKPKFDSFQTLNTALLYNTDTSKRGDRYRKLARTNIKSIISYCYKYKVGVKECRFSSSYIGAVGISQFMPMNFWLIDTTSKNKFSKLEKMEDAIMSTAHYYNRIGKWKKLRKLENLNNFNEILNSWYAYNKKNKAMNFSCKNSKIQKCQEKDIKDIKSMIKSIKRYNNSFNYASGVLQIAYNVSKINIK